MIAEIARFARKVLIRVIISRMKYYKQVLAIESLHTACGLICPHADVVLLLALRKPHGLRIELNDSPRELPFVQKFAVG